MQMSQKVTGEHPADQKNPTESSIGSLVRLSPVPILLGKIPRFILEAQLGIWVSSLTGLFSREGYFTEDAKRTISKIVENHIGLPQDGMMADEQVEGKTTCAGTSESSHQGLGSKTTITNTKRNLQVMKGGGKKLQSLKGSRAR